jgi:hypothetical protein
MSPNAIYTLFTDTAARFTPITGNPTDDDLTDIHEILTPLLLSIPYDEAGTHNYLAHPIPRPGPTHQLRHNHCQ